MSKASPSRKSASLGRRGGDRDAMAVFDQIAGQQSAKPSIVIDHENVGGVVGKQSRGLGWGRVHRAWPARFGGSCGPTLSRGAS